MNLDCGLVPKDTTYVEKSTNISYKSDATYIETGLPGKINDAYKTQFQQQTWALRSFPEGQRNCYNFNLTAKRRYLIRGTFIYGNYDGLNKLPSFELHIGPNNWTTVSTLGVTNGSIHEMIHVLPQSHLQVCLVKTGETTPFISSLELRPLHNETYVTQSGSLIAVARVYFSPTPSFVRYDEDIHDRTWVPFLETKTTALTTDALVDTSNFYHVPQPVAKTAADLKLVNLSGNPKLNSSALSDRLKERIDSKILTLILDKNQNQTTPKSKSSSVTVIAIAASVSAARLSATDSQYSKDMGIEVEMNSEANSSQEGRVRDEEANSKNAPTLYVM
ncbi:unnamed protein product [Thlaspi arvense]|uniref:Malectin-like domain-containing protein n=1 Tax=Thlaspi arvense TaxID=13288 RepID=A0AAU9R9A8_THLAR|nr:unnamed protein product [Thlaspi arvense]